MGKLAVELNSLEKGTKKLTGEQGVTVNRIAEDVENAKDEVRKGNDELVEAV